MKTRISLIAIILVAGACSTSYRELDKDFPNYIWGHDRVIQFSPEIEDIEKPYNLIFAFRHIHGIRFPDIPIHIVIVSPSGEKEELDLELQVMDGNQYKGNCAGDICDLEVVFRSKMKFAAAGVYEFSFSLANESNVSGVMEVGLTIK